MSSQIIGLLTSELDLNWANILPNGPIVLANPFTSRVHLLRVHPILRVQILNLPIREHPVELVLDLVLGPQPRPQSQALLLPSQLQQVRTLPHDGCTTRGHLKDLLFRGIPCDDIEFLDLGLPEQPSGASSEDRRRRVGVELRWGEPHGSLCLLGGGCGLCFLLCGSEESGGFEGLGGEGEGEGEGGGLFEGRRELGGGEGWGEEGSLGCHSHGEFAETEMVCG